MNLLVPTTTYLPPYLQTLYTAYKPYLTRFFAAIYVCIHTQKLASVPKGSFDCADRAAAHLRAQTPPLEATGQQESAVLV